MTWKKLEYKTGNECPRKGRMEEDCGEGKKSQGVVTAEEDEDGEGRIRR